VVQRHQKQRGDGTAAKKKNKAKLLLPKGLALKAKTTLSSEYASCITNITREYLT